MLGLKLKQGLSVFVAGLMLQPSPMSAAGTADVLGSISTFGAVTIGASKVPSESTLFSGDTVKTDTGKAVVNYEKGARVLLASTSTAVFSPKTVELKKGQMTIQSGKDMVFQATSLRIEPMSEKTSADVVVNDGKASITVKEGSIRAVDPSGTPLAVIPAGEAKLFAMAASAAAAPAPAAAASASAPPLWAPQTWLLVTLVAGGIVGAAVAISNASDDNAPPQLPAASPAR